MNIVEQAKFYYNDQNKNCAESILLASSDFFKLGLGVEDAKLLVGFGGGMGCGSTCGCLAGSIAVLGKMFAGKENFRAICADFVAQFKAEFGCDSIDCQPLSAKYKTPETRCEQAVVLCAQILQRYIEQLTF